MILRDIINRANQAREITDFHELDTIERIIVPVLKLAGWDVDSIQPMYLKRGNLDTTSNHRRFDMQLFSTERHEPRVAIECKKITDPIPWEGYGWTDKREDSLRQIRKDCSGGVHGYLAGWTIPIVTNGDIWFIVTHEFVEQEDLPGGITESNRMNYICAEKSLGDPDFETEIIARLRP